MEIIYAKANLEDVFELANLARKTFIETFGHLYSVENLEAHLNKTCSQKYFTNELQYGTRINIARCNNEMIGYIKFGIIGLPVQHLPNDTEIHRLYISSSFQNKGIGKKFMEMALQEPPLANSPNLYLGVWENNHIAQVFYSKYGFTPFGEYIYNVGSQADKEIIMRATRSS
jgi:diamine N-acetyltransferase